MVLTCWMCDGGNILWLDGLSLLLCPFLLSFFYGGISHVFFMGFCKVI
jgi:hypothetical protein